MKTHVRGNLRIVTERMPNGNWSAIHEDYEPGLGPYGLKGESVTEEDAIEDYEDQWLDWVEEEDAQAELRWHEEARSLCPYTDAEIERSQQLIAQVLGADFSKEDDKL